MRSIAKLKKESEADGILLTPGVLERVADVVGNLCIVLRLDGTHTRLGKHLERTDSITTVENTFPWAQIW